MRNLELGHGSVGLRAAVALLAVGAVAGGAVLWRRVHSFEWFRARLEADLGAPLSASSAVSLGTPAAEWEPAFASVARLPNGVETQFGARAPDEWFWTDEGGLQGGAALDHYLARTDAHVAALESASRTRAPVKPLPRREQEALSAWLAASARTVRVRAYRQAQLGRGDEAVASAALIYRMARAYSADCVVAASFRHEVRIYAFMAVTDALAAEPSDRACAALADEIDAVRDDELALSIEALRAEFLAGVAEAWRSKEPVLEAELQPLRPVPYLEHVRHVVQRLTELAACARASDPAAYEAAGRVIVLDRGTTRTFETTVALIAVAVRRYQRDRARRRVARVALALRRFRLRRGAYPATLRELEDAAGLTYERTEAGFRLADPDATIEVKR